MPTDDERSFDPSELLAAEAPPTMESIGQLSAAELGEGAAEGEFARIGPLAEIVGVRDFAGARPTNRAVRVTRLFLAAVYLLPILVFVFVLIREFVL